jgi:hypothetical protein
MNNIVKVISTRNDSLGRRLVKYLRYGKSDVQESLEISPYGIDSNPISEMVALYSSTGEIGKPVVVGYINKNKIADVGEIRLLATDEDGNEKSYIHVKNNGVVEVVFSAGDDIGEMQIGGESDNAVRYSELKKGFDQLKADLNSFKLAFNTHVHATAAVGPPVPPTPVPSSIPSSPSQADISKSKIDNIKTS